MKKIFYFGEKVKEYDVRVFNEREIRASSGIMLVGAMYAFMNAWLIGNYIPLRIFVVIFFIEFFIRLFINPKFSPSLIIGRFFTRNQEVEYTGAPQKKFAWGLGFTLSAVMMVLVVFMQVVRPVNLIICLMCLMFLFFETAFGICLGCRMYNLFTKKTANLCPGGACKIKVKHDIQKISIVQILSLIIFCIVIVLIGTVIVNKSVNAENQIEKTCTVPSGRKKLDMKIYINYIMDVNKKTLVMSVLFYVVFCF